MEIRTISAIRTAAAAGRFAEAESLLAELRHEVEAAWANAASDEERNSIAAEVGNSLEHARRVVLTARAHDLTNLARLASQREYGKLAPVPDIVHFDA